jgi:hypothetical protein
LRHLAGECRLAGGQSGLWRIEALPYRVGEFAKSPDFKGDWLRRMRSIAPFSWKAIGCGNEEGLAAAI